MTVYGYPPPAVPITDDELDLERARAIAVALEGELADLVAAMRDLAIRWAPEDRTGAAIRDRLVARGLW